MPDVKHYSGESTSSKPSYENRFTRQKVQNHREDLPIIDEGGRVGGGLQKNWNEQSDHVLPSQQMAADATNRALRMEYHEAVQIYSFALKYDPFDHRIFGNRSYCYEQLHQFDNALSDADKAINLASESCVRYAKGFYRKAKALEGLKKYREASTVYDELLRINPGCKEAGSAQMEVNLKYLASTIGHLDTDDEESLVESFSGTPTAAASTTCGSSISGTGSCGSINRVSSSSTRSSSYSDHSSPMSLQVPEMKPDLKKPVPQYADSKLTDPRNTLHCSTIWVGNLASGMTEKEIMELFGRFGSIKSHNLMLEKHCAFVNFYEWRNAGRAMEVMQNKLIRGKQLMVKFPDKAVGSGSAVTTVEKKIILKKK